MWIAWSVAFLLSANIIGSTVLGCLVNSVSFIRLLRVALVVVEWQTFSGSRHLDKYCAETSSECSLTFSILASTCRWSTLDILWQPVAILRAPFCVYWMFLCRIGLYSKHVQHSWWSISQLPCKSSVMSPSVVLSTGCTCQGLEDIVPTGNSLCYVADVLVEW